MNEAQEHKDTTTYFAATDGYKTITMAPNKCVGGHTWTYGGTLNLKGVYCDCGSVVYAKPKYCQSCGHQL